MPGAGKSTIATGLKSKGFEVFNMGDAVRAEAKKRNLEPTGKNLGKLMLELREKNGPSVVAELTKPHIINSSSDVVIIDGIRSNHELEVFKKIGTVKLLLIEASPDTRFKFLHERGRSDDPKTRELFDERDKREIGVGLSGSIASADKTISNSNLTKEELIEKAYNTIQSWT
jgi:dephospho-CoA kinase